MTDKQKTETWTYLEGLMLGVILFHAVQPLAVATKLLVYTDKIWVSFAGGILYFAVWEGLCHRTRWSLWGTIIGPCVGLTAVLLGWLLGALHIISLTIRPDVFQLSAGVLQVVALVNAIRLLKARV